MQPARHRTGRPDPADVVLAALDRHERNVVGRFGGVTVGMLIELTPLGRTTIQRALYSLQTDVARPRVRVLDEGPPVRYATTNTGRRRAPAAAARVQALSA